MIQYQITSKNPVTHYFDVRILIDNPDPGGQCLRLPNWIPGSYMIRDFSRHLVSMTASVDGELLRIHQQDKSNWCVEPCTGTLCIEYLVYARDLSVRGAHLDHTHGYYNGTSVFLEVVGRADESYQVLIGKPETDYSQNWRLATTLARQQAGEFGFGLYQAKDYDDLIDHPVEMGDFRQIRFQACGVPHDIILTGRFDCDEDRLVRDLTTICEHHIRFFGEPAPVDYYQFQVLVVGDGYGGLEHRSSTSLLCSRDSLPQPGESKVTESYREFLGLCSHEYFHTWNVKRIKPAVYQPYDLQQEVYTELLWAFEGITSYYDDLALVRCGLIEQTDYLELLAQTMTRVARGKGSRRQAAAESSFNAWTKFYKQDENAQNAIVSYYAKGALIALCIDLKMRALTDNQQSLDTVMSELWQRWQASAEGVGINSIQALICDLVGSDLQEFLDQLIQQTGDMPLQELLATVGVDVVRRASINQADKGGKESTEPLSEVSFGAFLKEQDGGLQIIRVDEDGSAQKAGLAAEDQIIAVDGIKLSLEKFERRIALAKPGNIWEVHAFRRDELHQFEVVLLEAAEHTIVLQVTDQQQAQRQDWLGGGH
ncbi:MAG: PDZ domain-containing protein [Gammaproteobacteria bacterium]|nr:PDZ domain-containing protein [Gammaproteobacteria bacterium]